jgi:hypothetical protein
MRLRDTRTGTEFLIQYERVIESDSLPRPAWKHEGDYLIILPNMGPARASYLVRIDCQTLMPLRLVKRGA